MRATVPAASASLLDAALHVLGLRNLVLALHDASFPGDADSDTGRGTPYGPAAAAFLAFARELGFNGIQLGPQGATAADNPSPYDGTVFMRSPLSISLARLADDPRFAGILERGTLAAILRERPADDRHVAHLFARRAQEAALEHAWRTLQAWRRTIVRGGGRDARARAVGRLAAQIARFRGSERSWLERDAVFEALAAGYGSEDWTRWVAPGGVTLDQRLYAPLPGEAAAARARLAELIASNDLAIDRFAFGQMVLDVQHRELRAHAAELGLRLFGDLQIGFAHRDRWSYRGLFLAGYVMGAPPSRTNPEGQAWGYPVLDPAQYVARRGARTAPGPVLQMVARRMAKMLGDFDGVRIDHPHGLVDPWVYRTAGEPLRAVRAGARLFSSPDLRDHPALARFAIARPEQLARDGATERWADLWVRGLSAGQVTRYAVLLDEVVRASRAAGRDARDLVAEVLSTCPDPLRRVLARYGLGRFRVTQKASLDDPRDVYRPENAVAADWVMLGNHDTRPIWLVIEEWRARGELAARAADVAGRLAGGAGRRALAGDLARHPGLLARAMLADLFASRARNVQVFFADLFGETEIFNRPGVASVDNWSLRVPRAYREAYRATLARGRALDVAGALALAIRARGLAAQHHALVAELEERSRAAAPALAASRAPRRRLRRRRAPVALVRSPRRRP